jgi:protein-S-isoprenylcysteine O-methyltransferase Ste14
LALIYAGVPLVQGYLWPYLFLPLVLFLIVRLVIEREERYLERKFGSDYTRYRDAVRRWI